MLEINPQMDDKKGEKKDIDVIMIDALDSSHALYLHHFDNPGCMLVTKPLTSDNYAT